MPEPKRAADNSNRVVSGRAYDEDAAFELDRACPIRNACSHRA